MVELAERWMPTRASRPSGEAHISGEVVMAPSATLGSVIGGTYRLTARLAEGGMATLFEGEDLRDQRRVAVKVLSPPFTSDETMRQQFRTEGRMLARAEHPHVVELLDSGTTEAGDPYLVLELLCGETLRERIRRVGPLPLDEVRAVTLQLASALAKAHSESIVHRDVKPSNVFLTGLPGKAPFVKLLDFGISRDLEADRHEQTGSWLVGTPEYMAPEQADAGSLVDGRTDQFALALTVYEMLTGEQPFWADDLSEVLNRVRGREPCPASSVVPGVPKQVDAVLSRALAKRRDARFKSVSEFAGTLALALAGEAPTETRPEATTADALEEISACLEQAKRLLANGDAGAAARLAETAFHLSEVASDPRADGIVRSAELLIARIFVCYLGSVTHALHPRETALSTGEPLCARSAFVLSRVEDGMTVGEAFDASGLPRLEVLRLLAKLVSTGAVTVDESGGRRIPATRGGA